MLSSTDQREICVIENTDVRHEFLEDYENALSNKGFTVRTIPEGSAVNTCPITTMYKAEWQWDFVWYLAYTNLKVYRNNHLEGRAFYNSRTGGGNMDKFIKAEKKIQELTNQLFPD